MASPRRLSMQVPFLSREDACCSGKSTELGFKRSPYLQSWLCSSLTVGSCIPVPTVLALLITNCGILYPRTYSPGSANH